MCNVSPAPNVGPRAGEHPPGAQVQSQSLKTTLDSPHSPKRVNWAEVLSKLSGPLPAGFPAQFDFHACAQEQACLLATLERS